MSNDEPQKSRLAGAKSDKSETPYWRLPLILFIQLSGWIVAPVVLALLLAWWLEKKYHTDSWVYLLVVGIAFLVSMIGMVREGKAAIRQMEKIDQEASQAKQKSKKINELDKHE